MREKEPFRFGAGPKTYSRWGVLFPLQLCPGYDVWLRCSIVEDEVPLLMSRPALKGLGAAMDLEKSELTFKKIDLTVPLITTSMGLVGFQIAELQEKNLPHGRRPDFEDFESK